jgi:hypothetical protein
MLNSLYTSTLSTAVDIETSARQRFETAKAKYETVDNTMSEEERNAIIEEY